MYQMSKYVLEMTGIEKSFPGIKVLKGVDFRVKPGEVHALMGENGAGKSTLMKILMGIYTSDAGFMQMNGQPLLNKGPKNAMENGISMIHQELNPVLDMQVFENVYMGREIKKGPGIVEKKKMIKETTQLLTTLGINISATQMMRDLSVAQCQLIEIVKAISINARIIVMDEPTSAITDKEIETLFEQIAILKKKNVAIIYISHKMDEIFKICDHITVLRDGAYIGDDEAVNLNREKLVRMMVGREINDVYPKLKVPIGDVVFEVKNLNLGKRVKNVNLQLRAGEILGVAGLVGAGRSELVESIFGMRRKDSGSIYKNGKELNISHPRHAIKNKIALITEDRKFTGFNLMGTVKENITLASLRDKISQNGLILKREEITQAEKYIESLKIKTPTRDTLAGDLSGGNQQKVVVAKWLLTDADIVILDEPTRGIDVGAKRDIYLLISELVKAGKAVIVISSEIPEIMGLCDRILVMAAGKLTGEIARENFEQELIMTYAANFSGGEEGLDEEGKVI